MKIADATFIVVDTETTGLDHAKDELIEVAAVATSLDWPVLGMWSTLVEPMRMIPPESSAVHGITEVDVMNAPAAPAVLDQLGEFASRFQFFGAYAAHNADFDRPFLKFDDMLYVPKIPMVCTVRLARHLWKNAPNYKNNTLRYWRGIKVETYGIAAHRALGDALVTAAVLRDLLRCAIMSGVTRVDDLIVLSDSPIIHETWPFGKYGPMHPNGAQPISAAPPDYVAWALRTPNLSRDMRYTLESHLKGEPLSA